MSLRIELYKILRCCFSFILQICDLMMLYYDLFHVTVKLLGGSLARVCMHVCISLCRESKHATFCTTKNCKKLDANQRSVIRKLIRMPPHISKLDWFKPCGNTISSNLI